MKRVWNSVTVGIWHCTTCGKLPFPYKTCVRLVSEMPTDTECSGRAKEVALLQQQGLQLQPQLQS